MTMTPVTPSSVNLDEMLSKLAVASAVIGNLPELPGYNGSILTIDDTEAARISDDLDEVHAAFAALTAPKFEKTYCSQCGGEFGSGDAGYSRCADHSAPTQAAPAAQAPKLHPEEAAAPGKGFLRFVTADGHIHGRPTVSDALAYIEAAPDVLRDAAPAAAVELVVTRNGKELTDQHRGVMEFIEQATVPERAAAVEPKALHRECATMEVSERCAMCRAAAGLTDEQVLKVFRANCVHFAGNYEVTPGQALQIAKVLRPASDNAKAAERWNMLPAVIQDHQIDYVQLVRDIDAAIAASKKGADHG